MDTNRYNRQMILPDFGISAQKKLSGSSVLVVGAGGLGCPVLQVLIAAGVRHIGIVDFDVVEIHNLHRQFLFNEDDVGKPKVLAAKNHLQKMNSDAEITIFNQKIDPENVFSIIQNYNVIVDCTDNFSTRYIINDACFLLEKPLVYGSVFRYEGQVAVFNVMKNGKLTSYRDLFPVPPKPDEIPNCNEAGVLPALSSIIGTIQANEVIKLLIDSDDILIHKLLVFNTKNYQTMIIGFGENLDKGYPKSQKELEAFDYGEFCGIGSFSEIKSFTELEDFLQQENSVVIDVREADELPRLTALRHKEIPLGKLSQQLELLKNYNTICFICASGIRSKKALEITQSYFPDKKIVHYSPGAKSIL